jgi:hypothetical protein
MNINRAALTLDRLHLDTSVKGLEIATKRPCSGRFLKGPISLTWLESAARCQGRALHIGIGLWYLAGLKKSRTISASYKVFRRLGLDRYAASRGLDYLEKAGLIQVRRKQGCSPIVILVV